MRPILVVATALTALASTGLRAQVTEHPYKTIPQSIDSGIVPNHAVFPSIVWSKVVRAPGATWLRISFSEATTLERGGILKLTSLDDGAVQFFEPWSLAEYRYASAYFNGEAVQVELLADARTATNRVVVRSVDAGEPLPTQGILSQCGPTDDRRPSNDKRAARQFPTGCTTWLIAPYAGCTAGHCTSNPSQMMEFNVPLSSSSGQIRHPGPEDQYPYAAGTLRRLYAGVGADWATFAVVRNSNHGLYPGERQGAWFKLGTPPSSGQIRITGYGIDRDQRDRSQTQQTHVGPLSFLSGTRLCYQTDTEGGNSGSPVIREDTGEAVGIHTHGGCLTSGGGCNSGTAISRSDLQAAIQAVLQSRSVGQYEPFGVACKGTKGLPTLAKVSVPPEIGLLFAVEGTNLPAQSIAILHFGSSDKQWGPAPLPLRLDGFGAAGCSQYVSVDFLLILPTGSGQVTWSTRIPNDKGLLGATWFNQLTVLDKGANAAGLTTSNAAKAVVGGVK